MGEKVGGHGRGLCRLFSPKNTRRVSRDLYGLGTQSIPTVLGTIDLWSLFLRLPIFLNSQLALFPAHKILGDDGREPENRTISGHRSFTQSFGT